MQLLSNSKLTQFIFGIVAVLIPFIVGCFIWTDIKDAFTQTQAVGKSSSENVQRTQERNIYIYYKLGEECEKVHVGRHIIFETENPDARIFLSVNNDHYCLPLDQKRTFIKMAGAQNVYLTDYDENDNRTVGLNILEVPGFSY